MHFNPNKLFRWLSIRTKLIIAFTSLSILPLLLVGVYSVLSNARALEEVAVENLNHDVLSTKEKAASFLSNAEADIYFLRHSFLFREFLKALIHRDARYERRLSDVEKQMLSFAESRKIYYQIRFIGADGEEFFRVENSSRASRVVPHIELRTGAEHFYRLLVSKLKAGQVAFTPAELLDDDGTTIPVISYGLPVIEGGVQRGILITNIFAKDLFKVLEGARHIEMQGKVVLVSEGGHYLYHPDKKRDWNKLLASREDENLWSEYPPDVAKEILSGKTGMVSAKIGEMISYAPLFDEKSGLSNSYIIYEAVPRDVILQPVKSFALLYLGMILVFLFGSVGLGFLATSQLADPIRKLQVGAEIISNGNYMHRLRIETNDEIEQLAQQFNAMATSLEKHEEEIQQHRTKLEEMVRQRTQELTEEKSKLQAILDNVHSAFVLLDRDFRIQTASAAFTAVTGKRYEDVKGRDCREVFCQGGFCRNCICQQALTSGGIESHIDQTADRKGSGRFIEHVAIPMKEDGEITSILEIITDVTERKQFEQNLIRTEKLMAAGEMSSIIAHEFRNSLTSIKMILQLQRESERLIQSDRKSLSVALNSIDHMEGIVTELLNFARPKPMEFRAEPLNGIINESLAFAQLHMNKRSITVKKVLDSALPEVLLDAPRFKEALINILLNAAQAIDGRNQRLSRGEIHILTKRTRLRNALRDFALAEGLGDKVSDSIGNEIVLKRGTECALIEISDTGCGIERTHLSRIFDPFFTTKTSGTGLGLPMVKRTVNAHRGIVSVKSKQGEGTTFSIYLPLSGGTKV